MPRLKFGLSFHYVLSLTLATQPPEIPLSISFQGEPWRAPYHADTNVRSYEHRAPSPLGAIDPVLALPNVASLAGSDT